MSRIIDYDPNKKLLLIQFPFDHMLREIVRSLPDRRWNPKEKAWTVPLAHLEETCTRLGPHGFQLTGELSSVFVERSMGQPASSLTSPKPTSAKPPAKVPVPPTSGQRRISLQEVMNPNLRSENPTAKKDKSKAKASDSTPANTKSSSADFFSSLFAQSSDLSTSSAPKSLKLSALNQRIREVIKGTFPRDVWVIGELSGFNRGKTRRHAFFELVEKAPKSNEVRAKASAVLWVGDRPLIERRLANAPEPFELEDGLEVRLKVMVDFYPANGRYQLIIKDIDPTYTLGKLALRREEILKALAAEGLIEKNSSLPFPLAPLRIALITSPDGEARRDFLHELTQSQFSFDIDLYAVRVQGPRLLRTVLASLKKIADAPQKYDAVVVIRGGGSRADLAWFDQLEIALAVAKLPLKVIIGIGHQRDQCVLDFIAHSEKTPTAAANVLVQRVEEFLSQTQHLWEKIQYRSGTLLQGQQDRLRRLSAELSVKFQHRLFGERLSLTTLQGRFSPMVREHIKRTNLQLIQHTRRLQGASELMLQQQKRELGHLGKGLSFSHFEASFLRDQSDLMVLQKRLLQASRMHLERESLRLESFRVRRRLLDPRTLLGRGYALVYREGGRLLRSARTPQDGERLSITFEDGVLHVEVKFLTETSDEP